MRCCAASRSSLARELAAKSCGALRDPPRRRCLRRLTGLTQSLGERKRTRSGFSADFRRRTSAFFARRLCAFPKTTGGMEALWNRFGVITCDDTRRDVVSERRFIWEGRADDLADFDRATSIAVANALIARGFMTRPARLSLPQYDRVFGCFTGLKRPARTLVGVQLALSPDEAAYVLGNSAESQDTLSPTANSLPIGARG